LGTPDKAEVKHLCDAKNEADCQPVFNAPPARTDLVTGDSNISGRTWQDVMDAMIKSVPRRL
jgi:hypothetical protein